MQMCDWQDSYKFGFLLFEESPQQNTSLCLFKMKHETWWNKWEKTVDYRRRTEELNQTFVKMSQCETVKLRYTTGLNHVNHLCQFLHSNTVTADFSGVKYYSDFLWWRSVPSDALYCSLTTNCNTVTLVLSLLSWHSFRQWMCNFLPSGLTVV